MRQVEDYLRDRLYPAQGRCAKPTSFWPVLVRTGGFPFVADAHQFHLWRPLVREQAIDEKRQTDLVVGKRFFLCGTTVVPAPITRAPRTAALSLVMVIMLMRVTAVPAPAAQENLFGKCRRLNRQVGKGGLCNVLRQMRVAVQEPASRGIYQVDVTADQFAEGGFRAVFSIIREQLPTVRHFHS